MATDGDRKPMAAVHVDLDGMRHVASVRGWDHAGGEDTLFLTGMRGLLDFLVEQDVTATLFVIAEQLEVPEHRALIEEAVAQGHEIASHTVTHEDHGERATHLAEVSRNGLHMIK